MRTHFVFLASAFPPPGCGQNLTRSVHRDFAHALGQHTRVAWMPSGAYTGRRALALVASTN